MIRIFQGLIREVRHEARTGGVEQPAARVVPCISFRLHPGVFRLQGPETTGFGERQHVLIAAMKSGPGWRVLAWRNLNLDQGSTFRLSTHLWPLPLWVAGAVIAYPRLPLLLLEALLNLGFVHGEILGRGLVLGITGGGVCTNLRTAWRHWRAHVLLAATPLRDPEAD